MRPRARWVARADDDGSGWVVHAPEPWDADRHLQTVRAPGDRAVVLGLDVPIGVPLAWAKGVGVTSFRDVLRRMADGTWPMFDQPAAAPDEISGARPFYPRAPGGTSRAQLVEGLGLRSPRDLFRACDLPVADAMPAAAPLFWLVGAQQVGKAALSAWTEVVAPAAALPHVRLWPMDGALGALAASGSAVIAEAYPRAAYTWPLGFPRTGWSKRRQADRAARGEEALRWVRSCGLRIELDAALRGALRDGFGPAATGEDPFDAVMGALQLIAVLDGQLPDCPPDLPEATRAVEGWMLGRPG